MAEKVRLLLCFECGTLEQLADYDGNPDLDWELNYLIEPHSFPSGEKHPGQLMNVEKKHWDNKSTRREIENKIRESRGHTGFDTSFYEAKETLKEDALVCFGKHNRNPGCPDYRSEKKRLSAGTNAERREIGLSPHRSDQFLCSYCPVHSLVMAAKTKDL